MQRLYDNPSYFSGKARQTITPASPWDFGTDKDFKEQNVLDVTAQDEIDDAVIISTSASTAAGYGNILFSQTFNVREPKNVLWHYKISAQLEMADVPVCVYAYVQQDEAGSAVRS